MSNSKATIQTTLIDHLATDNPDGLMEKLGTEMARFKNELGFPPDMFMSELKKKFDLDKSQQLIVTHYYCVALIQHKRESGAGEKALDRTRAHNMKLLHRAFTGEEMGEY